MNRHRIILRNGSNLSDLQWSATVLPNASANRQQPQASVIRHRSSGLRDKPYQPEVEEARAKQKSLFEVCVCVPESANLDPFFHSSVFVLTSKTHMGFPANICNW